LPVEGCEIRTQSIDTATLLPMVLSTVPSIYRNIAVAAVPKVVRAMSQRVMKIITAVVRVVAAMLSGG